MQLVGNPVCARRQNRQAENECERSRAASAEGTCQQSAKHQVFAKMPQRRDHVDIGPEKRRLNAAEPLLHQSEKPVAAGQVVACMGRHEEDERRPQDHGQPQRCNARACMRGPASNAATLRGGLGRSTSFPFPVIVNAGIIAFQGHPQRSRAMDSSCSGAVISRSGSASSA